MANENTALVEKKTYTDFSGEHIDKKIVLSIAEAGKTVESIQKAEKVGRIISTIFTYIFIVALAIIIIFPFYWMIITSLKQNEEINASVQTFFPNIVMWTNYIYVFQTFDFGTYMINTIVVGAFSTLGTLITTILGAFAFARLKFKGRDALFAIFLMTMMIPGELYTITNYVTVSNFGWSNTYIVMILPFLVSIYYIYLLRNTFKSIPESLHKAAKVDGCGKMAFLVKVMIPLAAPTLISVTLLKFIATWNSYIWPQLVNTQDYHLISNWMTSGFTNDGTLYPLTGVGSWAKSESLTTLRMCAACLVSMPLFVLFLFFRKYIMHGVSKSGTKG